MKIEELVKTLGELSKAATQTEDDIRYYSGGSKYNEPLEQLKDRLVNLYRTGKLVVVPDDAVERKDSSGLKYGDAAQDAVMSLLERGRCTIDKDGYLVAHPPTTTPVAVSETPVGDHQMVEAVAELQLAAFLAGRGSVTSMKHGTRTAKPCPTMDDFKGMAQAALTAARAQVEESEAAATIVQLQAELAEARKIKDQLMIAAAAAVKGSMDEYKRGYADAAREVPGRIVGWMREQCEVGDKALLNAMEGSQLRRDLSAGVVALNRAATAIEARDWSKP